MAEVMGWGRTKFAPAVNYEKARGKERDAGDSAPYRRVKNKESRPSGGSLCHKYFRWRVWRW